MEIARTVFDREVIAEFLPPFSHQRSRARPARKSKKHKVLILCQGVPSVPRHKELLHFISRKGFWVFFPRYRGSWESRGKFLRKSPHEDILDIINQLPRGFRDSRKEKTVKLKPDKVFLIGSSFGGPAAILASKDKRVDKVVCLSPVIDWQAQQRTTEPLDWLEKFIKRYFGRAFDFSAEDWRKLKKGSFYNPIAEIKRLDGKKIFIIHAKDDKVVSYKPAQKFAKLTSCKLKLLKTGGHLGLSFLMKNSSFTQTVLKFLN